MSTLLNIKSIPGCCLAVLLCVSAVFPEYADGQSASLDPSKNLSQYIHDDWQIDDGLPQNSVRALAQTSDGYLWLGTDDGLARFDGQSFKVFDKSNVDAFKGGHAIRALLADDLGVLWVGTTGSGLIQVADNHFSHVDSVQAVAISHISKDASGVMWIGSWDAGLFLLEQESIRHYSTESGLLSNFITDVHQDPGTGTWVGTREGLHFLDKDSVRTFAGNARLTSPFISALETDTEGALWVGTLESLHLVRDNTVTAVPEGLDPKLGIRTIWKDETGIMWIGTDQQGLFRYVDGKASSADASSGVLSSNRVLSFLKDTEGSLWIGTEMGGLNRFRNGIFTPYSVIEGFANDMSYGVAEDSDGKIWVGSDAGLNRINNDGSVSTYSQDDGLTSDVVMSLEASRDGGMWIGTMGGGLNKFENGRFRQPVDVARLPSPRIFALSETPAGDLWIGTDAGATRYSNGAITTYTTDDGLASDFLTTIHVRANGAVWFGTYDGGISRFENGEFTNITTADGLADNLVLDVVEDIEGNIWIGTANGLSMYREGEIESYSTENGLPSDVILSIVEDNLGGLWFSSTDGVFRVQNSQFDNVSDGDSTGIGYDLFDRSHGLRSAEMNGGFQPAAWKDSQGRLWFPSSSGVASVDPQNIFRNNVPPPVVLQDVVIDGRHVSRDIDATFEPGTKRIDIAYAGLSFIVPEQMQFRYILDGYETDWQIAGNARTATYTNLDPGHYSFRVIAQNSDGTWNRTGAEFNFYLQPFFYQTRWFFGLCLIALVLLAYSGYHLRVAQLKRREAELEATVEIRTRELRLEKEKTERQAAELEELSRFKTRFFANVSHEFRTPLTMIVGPLENALSGSHGEMSEGLRRQLEIMLRNSLRLMRLINQLLDLQKIEAGKMQLHAISGPISPFVEGILFSCSALAEQKNIALKFEDNNIASEIYFEPDKMEKVFYNLVSNALKFTPSGGTIGISFAEVPEFDAMPSGAIEIKISDTGGGIDPDKLDGIFNRFTQVHGSQPKEHEGTGIGLALVKDLVVLHGGSISVESIVGKGTTFTILLPAGSEHLDDGSIASASPEPLDTIKFPNVAMIGADVESTTDVAAPTTVQAVAKNNAPLVLIVDDNEDICQYMQQILESSFRIQIAYDGDEGLAKALEHLPDLIISDIQMPKMDGNVLCSLIKENETTRDIPVILLTARATSETVVEGLASGADDYMSKPFNARELVLRVTNLIQLFKQKRALQDINEKLGEMVQEQIDVILLEREEYEKSLIHAKEKAESSERLKTTILDNISHEFRTPITVILGYVDILIGEAPSNLGPFVQDIRQNSNRLLRTLDALLKYSELEAHVNDIRSESFDAEEKVRDILNRFDQIVVQKNIDLDVISPESPIMLECNAERFAYVIDNLVDNAVKFTNEGHVHVSLNVQASNVEIEIADTGIGIQPEFVPKLFETFSQESSGTNRSFEGTGLGLAFAKRLLDQIGGDVRVESTPGVGSTFTVILPAEINISELESNVTSAI